MSKAPDREVVIALDAMGGDKAPRSVIKGAKLSVAKNPNVRFLIYGDYERLDKLIGSSRKLRDKVEIIHTDKKVSPNDKPSQILRTGQQTSMRLAINAVAEKRAECIVSAGNTGALMAMSKLVLKTIPGVNRPAIATMFPTLTGSCVLLDVGANVDCNSDNLFQFAVMGESFARSVMDIERPRVGIINIGLEEIKGNDSVRNAANMLRSSGLPINFIGFVEGADISAGKVDVAVTDGFTGNVALKTAEGLARMILEGLRAGIKRSILGKIGFALMLPVFNNLKKKIDPRKHGGALLLGLNGVVIKAHGNADAIAISNAIKVAYQMAVNGTNQKVMEGFRLAPDLTSEENMVPAEIDVYQPPSQAVH